VKGWLEVTNMKQKVTLLHPHGPRRPVKVVAVTGGKGGVGKTSICANIAMALAALGRRVLLVDGDLGLANAHLMFGLRPARNLRHFVRGTHSLGDVVVEGPAGLKLVAGASGFDDMANLQPSEHAGIIRAFNDLETHLDVMLIDTAPGIGDSVLQFAGAAHRSLVILRDEPASIADAYAIVKLLHQRKQLARFDIVTNMATQSDGEAAFGKLNRAVERFLPVALTHAANIPADERVARAVRSQTTVVASFPKSLAALALKRLAYRVDAWSVPTEPTGNIEFFADRLMRRKARVVEIAL
jgi:flagellar biosynthesis protein FlhG